MEVAGDELQSVNLDHHGLVAAVCQDLGIAEKLNEVLGPADPQRVVSAGTSVVAMILNGLGFTQRRLYLTPQFFANKPVEKLLGEGIEASMLTDHTLGQTLDEIAAFGTSDLFAQIAFRIALEQGLLTSCNHLDSTSLRVHGEYANSDGAEAIELTYGHSKDHRPDLKQAVLSLVVNGPADIPLWMDALNGNSSDKVSFHETIDRVRAFQSQVAVETAFKWIADSALYGKDNLLAQNDYLWLCRVPETINAAKALVSRASEEIDWIERGGGYRTASTVSRYGGVDQRWLLVYSEQAYRREKKTLEKQLTKQQTQLDKTLWHLHNERFRCEADAWKALTPVLKRYPRFTLSMGVEAIARYPTAGRPRAGTEQVTVGYRLVGTGCRDEAAIAKALNAKGRFILATNDLDRDRYPDEQMLREYKEQQGVERGFRFLKDPWFMVDSIFLKSPQRIEALMMVMTLCLLVYNVAQYRLRETLENTQETLPNQVNKPIKNPTLRWIFQIMEGISIVRMIGGITQGVVKEFVTNLTDLRKKIIRFFGDTASRMYGLIPKTSKPGLGM
ncbi:MAG: IS1634 family transposase [Candidatus Competibacteraceae bacterium]|jgi:transposase|nr:IS1634 family transposase [Candidatus Competibacteraceae bacterium]